MSVFIVFMTCAAFAGTVSVFPMAAVEKDQRMAEDVDIGITHLVDACSLTFNPAWKRHLGRRLTDGSLGTAAVRGYQGKDPLVPYQPPAFGIHHDPRTGSLCKRLTVRCIQRKIAEEEQTVKPPVPS